MKLVPNWKLWWKRYSTWLGLSIPTLTLARDNLPQLQELIPLQEYKIAAAVLGLAVVIAVHVQQNSVSGVPDESGKAQ